MNINKLFKDEYRLTAEYIEDLLDNLNSKTKQSIKNLKRLPENTPYIEFEDGRRCSMKGIYSPKIYNLREVEEKCIAFVDETIKYLNTYDVVYLGEDWRIDYIPPSHRDLYTWDYVETPTKGCWIITGRFRGLNNEDLK